MKSFIFYLLLLQTKCQSTGGNDTPNNQGNQENIIDAFKIGGMDSCNFKPCEDCFWIGKKSLNETLLEGIDTEAKAVFKEARSKDAAYVLNYKIYPNFEITLDWVGGKNISDFYKCQKETMCEIIILWDGSDNFKPIFIQTTYVEQFISSEDYPEWEHENFNGAKIITHRFAGVNRQIIFNQVNTITNGQVDVDFWTFDNRKYTLNMVDVTNDIKVKDSFNPDIIFKAGIFGFLDKP